MKIIADAGSSKIDWCFIKDNHVSDRFVTDGFNPVMLSYEEIEHKISEALSGKIDNVADVEVYYYGAGCVSEEICGMIKDSFLQIIPDVAVIEIKTDLMGAARALCGSAAGIACILGTGSNSCFYNGKDITENVSPLGYILGDEGSGAVMGRQLVGDVLKHQLPEDICSAFLDKYRLDRTAIIQRVYREPLANRFLASLTPFLLENIHRKEIYALVFNSFKSFFKRNILNYKDCRKVDINFIGSIAFHYKDILTEAAEDCGCRIGMIEKSPMDGLIKYHTV